MEGEGKVSAGVEQQGRFKKICVFCGSRAGYKSAFSDAALELGKFLVILTLLLFTNSSKKYWVIFPLFNSSAFKSFACILLFTCFDLFCRLKGGLIWFMEEEA